MAKLTCNVIEMPFQCEWPVDETEGYPRDILPWADPYIAQLLRQQVRATGAYVVDGNEEDIDDLAFDEFDPNIEEAGSDWNNEEPGELPAAGDSPYEWDAFRFRGKGVL